MPMSLSKYQKYLEGRNMNHANKRFAVNQVSVWLEWLPKKAEESNYKDLMDYIGHLQEQGKNPAQANRILQAISHYYECYELKNVAIGTRIKGVVQKAKVAVFTEKQLDEMYELFIPKQGKGYYHLSDKLVLGLMIYQGLEVGDFMKIETKDVDLEKGKIYIPSRGHRRSRLLDLQAHQILQLYHYLFIDRPKHCNESSEKLLSPQGDGYNNFHWQYKKLSKEVKRQIKEKLDKEVIKLSQLRQSRITIWIRKYGLRKAQYMAGFRRVLSIERYQDPNLENLKAQVKTYHPFK